MNITVRYLAALLALSGTVSGCSGGATRDGSPDPTATSESAIEAGKPINVTSDFVSSLFPLSTVMVWTASNSNGCTGVILTPTQILTAAHCQPDSTTKIYLYPTTGSSSVPTGVKILASSTVAVAVPPGVVCNPDVAGSYPSTCYSNKHFSDLAVVTLASPIPPPYVAVTLGPTGQFAAISSRSSWAVGTGFMNGTVNPTNQMEWVASRLYSSDADGSFLTKAVYTDGGDSGGPLYQIAMTGDAGPGVYNLILVGILTGGSSTDDRYTSTEDTYNAGWILSQFGPLSGPDRVPRAILDLDLDWDGHLALPVNRSEPTPFPGL